MKQMMSLGGIVFSLGQGKPYIGLQLTSDGSWRTITRYGQKPISHNTGQSLENISLKATNPSDTKPNDRRYSTTFPSITNQPGHHRRSGKVQNAKRHHQNLHQPEPDGLAISLFSPSNERNIFYNGYHS